MSFLSENIIPGNYGKKFTTDATRPEDIKLIKDAIMKLEGIKEVIIEEGSQPMVFVVHTNKVVKVKDIEDQVKHLDFHALATGLFFPLA